MTFYIEWAEQTFSDRNQGVVLCVNPDERFVSFLQGVIDSRKIANTQRQLTVQQVTQASELSGCNILYVKTQGSGALAKACDCIVIGDSPNYRQFDTAINFFREGSRVRFEVNVNKLKQLRVRLSSELLKLARVLNA